MPNWQELEKKYYTQVTKRQPAVLVRGEGVRVWDDKGKAYLDFVAGWAVTNLGHCPPVLVKAVQEQVATLDLVSNAYYTIPQLQLAELLVENSCLDRVFFCNSGAEANEGAVKLARKYGRLHRNGAYEVITTWKSFHGRTLAMVAATGKPQYQEPFQPLPVGFVNVDYNDLDAIKAATNPRTCAVMLEPVQGEGGVNIPHESYFEDLRAWCDEQGILLILDEVQTGVGRLGTLWGYQQTGMEPDIMTVAKGLANGVPIGAFLAKEQVAAAFAPGEHGSTFGGSPIACAAGYAVTKYVIEHDVPSHARRMGQYLMKKLQELQTRYPVIKDVRGRGLLIAVEFRREVSADVVATALEEGLLLNPVMPTAIRLMPPLIITEGDVDEAVAILDRVLARIEAKAEAEAQGRAAGSL